MPRQRRRSTASRPAGVLAWRRLAREKVIVGGTSLQDGAKVLPSLSSENDDLQRTPRPERYAG